MDEGKLEQCLMISNRKNNLSLFSFFHPPLHILSPLSLLCLSVPAPEGVITVLSLLSLSITAFQIFKSPLLAVSSLVLGFVSSGTAGDSRLAASPAEKRAKKQRGEREQTSRNSNPPRTTQPSMENLRPGRKMSFLSNLTPVVLLIIIYSGSWSLAGRLGSPQKLPDLQRRVPLGRGPGLQGPGRGTQHHRVGVRGALWVYTLGCGQGASLRAPSTWTQPPSSSAAGQRLLSPNRAEPVPLRGPAPQVRVSAQRMPLAVPSSGNFAGISPCRMRWENAMANLL